MDEKELLEEIKNNLTIEQIEELLINLDADPQVQGNFIIARTICHCGNSHKLYYYDNTHLFKCFTECDSTFDVFELIIKVKKGAGLEIALPQAIQYILNFFNLGTIKDDFKHNEMCRVKIPLPPIEVQESIVAIFKCAEKARSIAERAREEMKRICPAMIQRAAHQ